MKKEFIYNLKTELEYSYKGDFIKAYSITFKPPGMDVLDEMTDFEQLFLGSVVSAGNLFKRGEEDKPSEEEKSALQHLKDNIPSSDEIRMLITMSQEIKVRDIFKAFKRLAKKTAMIDDKEKLKDSHFDRLSGPDEALDMMCEYASFFTFPSLLGGGSQEENGTATSAM